MAHLLLLPLMVLIANALGAQSKIHDVDMVTNFTVHMVKTPQAIIFGCDQKDLRTTTSALMHWNRITQVINVPTTQKLTAILSRRNYARTLLLLDCACNGTNSILLQVAEEHYFNKTYQWLLWDTANSGIASILPLELDYLGPNAQVTYVNGTISNGFYLWDLHSKGLHLNSPLVVKLLAIWHSPKSLNDDNLPSTGGYFTQHLDIFEQQSLKHRDQFNGLTMRGAVVIDEDNITTNDQIVEILTRRSKDAGVATFVKYHYHLLLILRERFNFTVNFRNSLGWAGRLGNTTFRLGMLGVVMRNEADVAASGAYTRINRFAEFDTIHQSWKFDTGFLYRFTPDLDAHGKSGNFLAPFDGRVWCYAIATLFVVNFMWRLVEWLKKRWRLNNNDDTNRNNNDVVSSESDIVSHVDTEAVEHNDDDDDTETSLVGLSLKTFAAICQQGMEPIPNGLPSRTIILTVFIFSLMMYNFYTSSVVGGLLSLSAQGPATVDDVIASPLMVSFEDIGYYKVMFKEAKTPIITRLHQEKIEMIKRSSTDLPVYAHVEDAIPYLKKGGYAFHCEAIDAYPGIAKLFDVEDICDLRMVSGLLETEVFNWVVPKRSQYTEIFRIVMAQTTEVGLVKRAQHIWRADRPQCQAQYRVFPITLSGVLGAFFILGGGYLCAVIALLIECKINVAGKVKKVKFNNSKI